VERAGKSWRELGSIGRKGRWESFVQLTALRRFGLVIASYWGVAGRARPRRCVNYQNGRAHGELPKFNCRCED
jgi:hypothetical protein